MSSTQVVTSVRPRRYRGHRQNSFVAGDMPELMELRARQRTFHGAYTRAALGNFGYALIILRLFDRRFYKIGVLFATLGASLFLISFIRSRHSYHDFSDTVALYNHKFESANDTSPEETMRARSMLKRRKPPIITQGQCGPNKRCFGKPFVTAGPIILAVACIVFAMEVGLLVLIGQL